MYIQAVLRGVLYPEAHFNGFKKKKRFGKARSDLGDRSKKHSNWTTGAE
jgi:hypothetical protein